MLKGKMENIENFTSVSPVIVINVPTALLGDTVEISGKIDSKELGVVNGKNGLIKPMWLKKLEAMGEGSTLVIKDIDRVYKPDQEKFYELLKYRSIGGVDLPANTKIILTAKDISKVAENILKLCVVIK